MKPEAKSENPFLVKKAEAEISTSVGKADGENSVPASKAAEVPPENEFEKRRRPEAIPANEIGVPFSATNYELDEAIMMSAVIVSMVEAELQSTGAYNVASRLAIATPPAPYVLSRGIG